VAWTPQNPVKAPLLIYFALPARHHIHTYTLLLNMTRASRVLSCCQEGINFNLKENDDLQLLHTFAVYKKFYIWLEL